MEKQGYRKLQIITVDQVVKGSYPADLLDCKNSITTFFQESYAENMENEETLQKLWDLLQKKKEERKAQKDHLLKDIARKSLFMPARVFIYLASEFTKQEFWSNWQRLSKSVYQDEDMKKYASEELEETRKRELEKPTPGIPTCEYLKNDNWFNYIGTPEELIDKPRYYISDDDRLYWWDGSDEVTISEKTDQWLKKLASRHKELMKNEETDNKEKGSDVILKDFFLLLVEVEKYYQRVFPFQTMFYEFIQNGDKVEYMAAMALLGELYEENKEEGKVINYIKGSWDLTSRIVTFNPGRICMKRYMSVMANRKLRKIYFGF